MADKSATARDYRAKKDGNSWVIWSPSVGHDPLMEGGSVKRFGNRDEAGEYARDINNRMLGPSDYFTRVFGKAR